MKVIAYNKQYYAVGYDLVNSSVLSLSVKRASEGAVLTCSGKLFQACGAATENHVCSSLNHIHSNLSRAKNTQLINYMHFSRRGFLPLTAAPP